MEKNLVHKLFEAVAEKYPANLAIEESGRTTDYRQLNKLSNGLAQFLSSKQIQKGAIVGVFAKASLELTTSLLAIQKMGGVYLPLSDTFPKKRWSQILKQTAPSVILCHPQDTKALQENLVGHETHTDTIFSVDFASNTVKVHGFKNHHWSVSEETFSPSEVNVDYEADGEDASYIIYTSGSTGQPKAILGCHKSLAHFIRWEIEEFQIDRHLRFGQVAQVTFDASLRDILVPLCSGATLCIPAEEVRFNPIKLVEWLEKNQVNLLHLVPSFFRLLTQSIVKSENNVQLPSLRFILLAGEKLYAKDIQNWQQKVGRHTEIVNLYGTTETTLAKTCHRIKELPDSPAQVLHVGQPISNTFIAVINDHKLCKIGEIGEIYIRTPYLTKGYYNDVNATKQIFVQNPLTEEEDIIHKTGDIGRYLPDRSLEVLGRNDGQVKVNGIRVELAEIETAVFGIPGIEQAVVTTYKNQENQTEMICYYVGDVPKSAIIDHLKEEVHEALIPSYFVPLPSFPLTINGKINKKELPKPDELTRQYQQDSGEHKNDTETKIEEIWSRVLGIKSISKKVSFFEIGGNSLKAIQIIGRLYKEFGILIKINEIFTNQSIEQLAAFITKSTAGSYREIPAIRKQDYYELSHAQKRLWLIDQVGNSATKYNVPGFYKLHGELQVEPFKNAIYELIKRHEILRTTFHLVDGEPRQRVHPVDNFPSLVEFHDFSSTENKKDALAQFMKEEAAHSFSLENGPLLRAILLQVGDSEYVFSFTTHHIVSDAWSLDIIAGEVFTLYNAFSKGENIPLPPLKIHYKDYAAWHNQELTDKGTKELKRYWNKVMTDKVSALMLPYDKPKHENTPTGTGKRMLFALSHETEAAITELAKGQGISLFMIFLAYLNATLYAYSKSRDIIVGSPVTGRDHPDLEDQIGFYINTILLRTKFANCHRFSDLLKEVKHVSLEAMKHQSYPYDLLVEDVKSNDTSNGNPLFDVGYTYINMDSLGGLETDQGFDNVQVEFLDYDTDQVKADIWYKIIECDGKFVISLSYDSALFEKETITTFFKSLQAIVTTTLQNPDIELTELVKEVDKNRKESLKQRQQEVQNKSIGILQAISLQSE